MEKTVMQTTIACDIDDDADDIVVVDDDDDEVCINVQIVTN